MDEVRRELLAYRVMTGETIVTVCDNSYLLTAPNAIIRCQAQSMYERALREIRFERWLTEKQCLLLLVKHGFCTAEIDNNLKEIETRIEDLKVQLYEQLFMPERYRETHTMLAKVKAKKEEMIRHRHMFDHLTAKGFAESVKRQFIVCSTLYHLDSKQLVWPSMDDVDPIMLERVMAKLSQEHITIEQIREIARNEPWYGYWNVGKPNPFAKPIFELTEEQKALVLFSKMYDNAAQHPKCPPDDIFDNDDLFDGWLLKEKRTRERERMTEQVQSRIGKRQSKADELFIPVQRRGDKELTNDELKDRIKEINGMNDVQGKVIKHQRKQTIRKLGTAKDSQFRDRQVQIQMQANKEFVEKVKGRK